MESSQHLHPLRLDPPQSGLLIVGGEEEQTWLPLKIKMTSVLAASLRCYLHEGIFIASLVKSLGLLWGETLDL
jgi:hypothetical protein